MFDMVMDSIILFCQGRLFKNMGHVVKQAAIGITICTVLVVVMAKVGLPLWLAIIIASLISGAMQSYLFKDLKYA
ncbi:MAG: hypothetical protein JKY88_16360 [Pseudomonadales bacterium]|nr:hypothetical protein [Pseudomonadales bacterium]